ncbi:MAG: putative pre6S rRNA nuclease [Thermodesulfobacteriota bacterium]|nr:putative pre6S rRNA nuclease [Thermodesulfobacteriota bacterium]
MRIMGLDYGEKRIGVAVSDEMGLISQPVAVVVRQNRKKDLESITALVRKYRPEKIVIGYPVRLDGAEGIQCQKVNRFAATLASHLKLPVIRWDETFSTKEAEEILRHSHMKREKRKEVVDKLAASIILQDYLRALPSRQTA